MDAFRSAARNCALPPSIELIGERWSFLILRGAFNGLQHFEQFQAGLGIARNILSNRLARLVEGGILDRRQDLADRRKVIYSLSPKGAALLPVLIALRQWGQDWGLGSKDILLADKRDGVPVKRIKVESADGRPLELADLIWIDGRTGKRLGDIVE
jgi:DNA-binding HxlR family transcriptional regulator